MTGFREQEMVHLFWSDVNARLRSIRVTSKPKYGFSPKRWEEREVPVPIQLIELLADHPRRETSELVFPSRMGNREQNMLLRCKEVATRAGLDAAKFDIKTFRSTYATRMLRTGFDVRTVQHWMGHKSLETTMRYLVPATEVHDRLDRVLLPGTIPERKGPTAAEGPKLLEGRPPAKQSRRR
jgi:integrase